MSFSAEFHITGNTRIAGLIGWPVSHTLSPAMHNAAFAGMGINAAYLPLGVRPHHIKRLLATLQDLGALGVNITIPYKEKVISLVDECASEAVDIGAVNTIVFKNDRMIGYNTDGWGFLASLKGRFKPRKKNAVLLGGGGAGRAVAVSLLKAGVAHLTVADPDARRLHRLMTDMRTLGYRNVRGVKPATPELHEHLRETGLLVNATPLGLKPDDPLPLSPVWMPRGICVMDLVYGRKPTAFLKTAQQQGNQVIPGWYMLLNQGIESFRIWTGKKPPIEIMRRALIKAGGLKDV
ncbi:shikimate dehydrogenase [bacterium]|nr:shikimate dehydrogenase [bacterium]